MQASLVVQTIQNLPAVQETQVETLGWKQPWGREWKPTPVFSPGEFHGQKKLASLCSRGCKESDKTE